MSDNEDPYIATARLESVEIVLFEIMLLLGWQFNKENGIWFKDGIKTNQGIFMNIRPNSGKVMESNVGRNKRIKELMTPDTVAEMKRLRSKGYSIVDVAAMYGVGKKVVENWTNKLN